MQDITKTDLRVKAHNVTDLKYAQRRWEEMYTRYQHRCMHVNCAIEDCNNGRREQVWAVRCDEHVPKCEVLYC